MPRRRSASKHPSVASHTTQETVAPKGPSFQFVTLDPGMGLERRAAYLATVRRKPARVTAG